jgi:hypothetical protein
MVRFGSLNHPNPNRVCKEILCLQFWKGSIRRPQYRTLKFWSIIHHVSNETVRIQLKKVKSNQKSPFCMKATSM